MEPNKSQHNSQTALFAIAIILALGVGFYMGYQTGFVNGGANMHSSMDTGMGDHMHSMMHGDETTHTAATPSTGDAMKMMDMGQ
jgi:hypothetical protein